MLWHAGRDSFQSTERCELDPSLGIMWETGHFWLLIVYLFTAFGDTTPAHLPQRRCTRQSIWMREPEVAGNGKPQAPDALCDRCVRTAWGRRERLT